MESRVHDVAGSPHAARITTQPGDHSLAQEGSGAADAAMLASAVQLALDNAAAGQLPFGALVVRAGTVLATGVNTALQDFDPVAHAEVAAVRNACRSLGVLHLTGATVYSSCEPCAVCHAVAAATGVARVVYAAPKEDVPDLGYPAPSDNYELLVRMQRLLRSAAPDQIVYMPTSGAAEPFRRFLAQRGRP